MDPTYFSIAGLSSHALIRVKDAQGSESAPVGIGCSSRMDVSTMDSAGLTFDASNSLVLPDVEIVEPSVIEGSRSDWLTSSAKIREGLGCCDSHGKIARGFSERGAGFSFGTSYHMFFGGLGYL